MPLCSGPRSTDSDDAAYTPVSQTEVARVFPLKLEIPRYEL